MPDPQGFAAAYVNDLGLSLINSKLTPQTRTDSLRIATMDTLKLRIDGEVFEVDLVETSSPNTLQSLKTLLPFKADLRYAKVAGEEVMAMVPFYTPLERSIEVSDTKPGMLVYYPPRQLLCLYYGRIQPEAEQVNVLGYVRGNLEELRRHGEAVREDLGTKLHYCDIYTHPLSTDPRPVHPGPPFLDDFEQQVWVEMPKEISRLRGQIGIMHPAGPTLYAEAETRVCHDFLTIAFSKVPSAPNDLRNFKVLLQESLSYIHNKMGGWYGLSETARVIDRYSTALAESVSEEAVQALLGSMMLFVGRVNMWLDAVIPWNDLNECMKSRDSI